MTPRSATPGTRRRPPRTRWPPTSNASPSAPSASRRRRSHRLTAGRDLTFPQWRALLILGESEDGARIGQVAARVGVTLPATSRLLRRLERRGLVALAVDDSDRRATRARLTVPGRMVRSTILAHRRAVLDEIVQALGDDDRRDLAAGLAAIADAMGDLS